MKTQCPHCKRSGNHLVTETEPELFHWDKWTVGMFERIAGYDLSFRRHTRRCNICGLPFNAIEMSYHHLSALIGEAQRAELLARQLTEAQSKIDALREQIQQIADVALSKPSMAVKA